MKKIFTASSNGVLGWNDLNYLLMLKVESKKNSTFMTDKDKSSEFLNGFYKKMNGSIGNYRTFIKGLFFQF
ncbi:MAG: hypothetical protein V4683_01290 [Bacteroidota bacterium]